MSVVATIFYFLYDLSMDCYASVTRRCVRAEQTRDFTRLHHAHTYHKHNIVSRDYDLPVICFIDATALTEYNRLMTEFYRKSIERQYAIDIL